ncbi:MAG TPA: hypothetical protein DD677_08130 [Stenotrophomonas sp.]|nr:hypothetical protein [Stenotrophomonas sp.]
MESIEQTKLPVFDSCSIAMDSKNLLTCIVRQDKKLSQRTKQFRMGAHFQNFAPGIRAGSVCVFFSALLQDQQKVIS